MKIVCYTYDDINNPWCGGGGAHRIETVHELLAVQGHDITFITGSYPGCEKKHSKFAKKHFGLSCSYLISRLTYTIVANVHSLFCKADVFLTVFSVYAPVVNFMFRKKVILEFYHLLGKRTVDKYGFAGWLPYYFEKLMLKHSRTIITMAPGTKTSVLEMFPNKEIYALPCGFDEKQLRLEPEDHKYVLVFGRIDIYMKGIDRLIPVMDKVLTKVDGYRLKIAGRGSDEDIRTLHKLVDDSGIRDKVDIIINPQYNEKLELFKKCTYVAIFSRFEGWCIVAIEAAAAGKAILGVDVEGLRDSVNNGYNGILVKDFDAEKIVEVGIQFLEDYEFRKKYENNSRQHASQYTWEKIALMQENVYKSVINSEIAKHV